MVAYICDPTFGRLRQESRGFETIGLHREF